MTTVPRLMLVTNRRAAHLPLPEVVRRAVRGGVDSIQIREKDLSIRELTDLTREIVAAAGDARVVVNGSIDVARDLGIGVHLPEQGPSATEARAALGADALIGRSVHASASARDSVGADYLIAGHLFSTNSKPGAEPIGPNGLRRIVAASNLPVITIGGIGAKNVRESLASGAKGVAIMSAINDSSDPERAAAEIVEAMDAASSTIPITLNGREIDIAAGSTIQAFLDQRGFKDRLVVVEINGKIAPKSSYSTRVFEPEDGVEIVHFVGGG